MKKPRIFVQIAAYRDPECHHTIRDLFEKAAHPERIFVGVCWQYHPEDDKEYLTVDYPRAEQVRVIQYHVRDAQGAGWARCQAQSLWQGEEYILQIQAHHRFEPGWDETLIECLHKLPGEKTVLTAWLPAYVPPDKKPPLNDQLPFAVVNRIGKQEDAQVVHFIKRMVPEAQLRDKLLPMPSWIGNFMFTRAGTLTEVPFDPYIYFWGEELNYSARLWTHGYDIYHLDRLVLYHYWDRKEVKDAPVYRDHHDKRNALSLMRNLHLLGLAPTSDPQALKELDKYLLGNVRSLKDYWEFYGIDPVRRTISAKAREGRWSMPQDVATADKPGIFVAIASYRDVECEHTIKDLFAKAKFPGRVYVGVCLQVDPKEDKHCIFTPDHPGQVRIMQVHYSESLGANWARAKAHTLRQDEPYVLQIDSHMRFEPGWDDDLIDMLERCPSDKPVISAYLPNYDPPDKRDYTPGELLRIKVRKLGAALDPQLVHITGEFVSLDDPRARLYPSPYFVANFMFARASTLQEVPIDPHFHFYGDEISYSARLWTHGYDIFQPDRTVAFHHWVRAETLHLQHYRNTRTEKSKHSLARGRHLLRLERSRDTQALTEIDAYGLGKERLLSDFWAFAGIDWRKRVIDKAAKQGQWNMAARQKALKKGNSKPKTAAARPRIFVQIASYRDPDCQWTVKDLFEKATHPERIFVGICWQTIRAEDAICFKEPYPYPDQVRVHEMDARDAKGVCYARHLTQKLWQGEEFTLQIDSHMRFEPGWDETLLGMWHDCENPKTVLTSYPPGFTPPNDCKRELIWGMGAKEFDQYGIFLMHGKPAFTLDKLPEKPIVGAFASACMFFGPASIIQDVPYDPHLYFFGEEISLAVRFWTHGYDLFHPNQPFIYHDWDRGKRPTHFSDHRDWGKLNDKSFARVKHMLGTEKSSDPEVLAELDQYGLGNARSLEEYQRYSGVDFSQKTISEYALEGLFKPYEPMTPKSRKISGKRQSNGDARIYVQIASYRDRECQWTVKDLFEKAKNPDRISVGICWQFDEEKDKDCFQVSTRPEQVRVLPVDWRKAEGVCWARHQTQQLWEGEDYTLQIDAHMRFFPGWDDIMMAELDACEADKPLLSCSPASYTPPNNLQKDPLPTIRRVQPFFPDGNIRGKGEYIDRSPEKPLNGAFVAAGFVFARGNIISEVPYDPYLYFDQEEIMYAARLYTHGWDVFSTRTPMLYHLYNTDPKGSVRPLHWRDLLLEKEEQKIAFLRDRGLKRFNHLTEYARSNDPKVLQDIEKYGYGSVRTLHQFEEYTGIDFKRKHASERALRCQFIKGLEKYRDNPIHIPEIDGNMPANRPGRPPRPLPPQAAGSDPRKLPPIPPKMLEPGDFVPLIELEDTNRHVRGMEVHGGRHSMVFFLPASNPDYALAFLRALQQQLSQGPRMEIWQLFIMDDTVENLIKFKETHKLPHAFWADTGRKVSQAVGVCHPLEGTVIPTGFLLDRNLKIIRRHTFVSPQQLAAAMVHDCRQELERYRSSHRDPRTISELAPSLIVPHAFSKELCEKCIQAFRTGYTFEGTVGAEDKSGYKPNAKVRTDYIVGGALLEEIDNKLSRSLFPEIEKVFGFEVTHRENYKIGLYSGEKGGFFKQHRDNFDVPLGYRRIAMTLHLNDDYEGGGLYFPEYGEDIYRPATGSAITFSCGTLHEARPVTSGERLVVVGFFHGEEEEAFRRHYMAEKNQPTKIKEYTPKLRQFHDIRRGRDFFRKWHKENVSYAAGTLPAVARENKPNILINSLGDHQPKKVLECKNAIIFDDFLPEDVYQRINDFAIKTDYEYINTKGPIARAWHVHDGFPLRSSTNLFYYAPGAQKPESGLTLYPSKTDLDLFIDHLLAVQPHVEHLTGKMDQDWAHVSATAWIYPPGTGLAMHDDGSGVYTGAYVYFLNPTWRLHWGGLLLMVDEEANQLVYDYRRAHDQMDFYKRKWLHANNLDDMLMEHGLAKCIFPKRNRIVFIANEAYHMVTRVNESAGDNHRMSLAGFFNRKKPTGPQGGNY